MLMFSTFAALWLRWSSPVSHEQLQELQYVKKAHSLRSTKSLHRRPLFYRGDRNQFKEALLNKTSDRIKHLHARKALPAAYHVAIFFFCLYNRLPVSCLSWEKAIMAFKWEKKKRKRRKTRKVRLPHKENKRREMKGNGGVWRISESLLVSCHCVWFGGNQKLFIKIAANLLVGVCADCLAT